MFVAAFYKCKLCGERFCINISEIEKETIGDSEDNIVKAFGYRQSTYPSIVHKCTSRDKGDSYLRIMDRGVADFIGYHVSELTEHGLELRERGIELKENPDERRG
jgi:hypothetical protein